ncbi:MAG: sensor histidine kinase [Luteolibacter sp.]|nr:sensor histidine kinase [Luteolibacter sp.]
MRFFRKEQAACRQETELTPGLEAEVGVMSLPEARIAVLYVALASIWILVSDSLLGKVVADQDMVWFCQSIKGLNFVMTTGVALYLILRRAYGGWRRAEQRRIEAARSAIQTLRQLSTRVELLREEERARIAREVHDELGQLLTGIKMQLRLIENRLSDRDDRSLNPFIDELVEAAGTVDEAICSVRRISSGLRPLTLDHLGLANALREEAADFAHKTGIACHIAVTDMDERIPGEVEIAVFRIFQESLTNVARHAEANRIDAECEIRDGVLILRVCDDGVGIDRAQLRQGGSLGLTGMRERAAGAGGGIEFRNLPQKGTEVMLTIPLSANHQAPPPPP